MKAHTRLASVRSYNYDAVSRAERIDASMTKYEDIALFKLTWRQTNVNLPPPF